jgi:hypothetical protein
VDLSNESPVPFQALFIDEQEMFCIVDREDYQWALQWMWRPKWDKHGRKAYAVRSMDVGAGRAAGRRQVTIYLHKEICLRANGPPPTPRHTIGDHKDGNSLNCRRGNMRWATPSENRLNIDGWYTRQLRMLV